MKITETPDTFFDIIIIFLYDMIININESVIDRKDLLEIVEMLKKKGLKTQFMNHYLSLDSQQRLEYKRIKEIFYNKKSKLVTIKIVNDSSLNEDNENNEELDENFYKLKDQVRQVINLIKRQKYKKPYKLINDYTIDKIITHVLKENK